MKEHCADRLCQNRTRKRSRLDRLEDFLRDEGFVVLAMNHEDPSPEAPFEAWAYEGPPDFDRAGSVVFGLGADCRSALNALNDLIPAGSGQNDSPSQSTS